MAVAYFDCFAGAGGDMIVASLLDAGADLGPIEKQLAGLGLEGYTLQTQQVRRRGIAATRFIVEVDADAPQPHRHLHHILDMIDAAGLPERAARRAKETFTRLGEAEAHVHGVGIEEVHFHEVGAVDSILDIVGACLALEQLGIDTLHCGPIPLGSGTIDCDHGVMPVPAPATAQLVRGFQTTPGLNKGEATTPTAAALFTALCSGVGPMPPMTVQSVGHGAGTREGDPIANVLRVLIGSGQAEGDQDSVVQLEANLDDCSGQLLGAAIEQLLEAGCLDAWATPAVMKKSRPAWVLAALCRPQDIAAAEEILFAETPTLGIRRQTLSRSTLIRRFETVETAFGPIRVKVSGRGDACLNASPEFDDCRQAARSHHVPVRRVIEAAVQAFSAGKPT